MRPHQASRPLGAWVSGRPNLAWPSLWAPRFLDAWACGPPIAWATRSLGAQRRRRLLVFLFNLCGPMWLLVFFLCGCSCGRFFLLWLFFVHVGVFPFLIFFALPFRLCGAGCPHSVAPPAQGRSRASQRLRSNFAAAVLARGVDRGHSNLAAAVTSWKRTQTEITVKTSQRTPHCRVTLKLRSSCAGAQANKRYHVQASQPKCQRRSGTSQGNQQARGECLVMRVHLSI